MSYYKHLLQAAAAIAVSLLAAPSWAQFVIDGSRDASYGAALSIQNTNTQFGNAMNGDAINAGGGSEIDAVYAKVSSGRLYVLVTGNLETNFNKLNVFIDSQVGGVNSIVGSALPGGVDSFCCGGFTPPDGNNTNNVGALQQMQGLTFDTGFEADHYLTFAAGSETVSPNSQPLGFFAFTSHYANLTNGTAGAKGALGMQLAQRGLPNVLRGTSADFDIDGDSDGNDFLIWQRNLGAANPSRLQGNADGSSQTNPADVDADDLAIIKAAYGFKISTATFGANHFAPNTAGVDNSEVLLGPALPNLAQGKLIDKNYAFGPGGATDNAGTGAITRELEFALPPVTGTTNAASHRDMNNIVDLEMALDNSNTAGVSGASPYTTPTAEAPGDVTKGIEFSIPLSQIGNPTGAVKLVAFVTNGGHDYASNQFAGTGILDSNLGSDGFGNFVAGNLNGVNMNDYASDQFVTIPNPAVPATSPVPEPAATSLFALALLGLSARSRRN